MRIQVKPRTDIQYHSVTHKFNFTICSIHADDNLSLSVTVLILQQQNLLTLYPSDHSVLMLWALQRISSQSMAKWVLSVLKRSFDSACPGKASEDNFTELKLLCRSPTLSDNVAKLKWGSNIIGAKPKAAWKNARACKVQTQRLLERMLRPAKYAHNHWIWEGMPQEGFEPKMWNNVPDHMIQV